MIVDVRVHDCKVNRTKDFWKHYRELAFEGQKRHLGIPIGFFTTSEGILNRIIHVWAYADLADRDVRRRAWAADPDFLKFSSIIQEEKILVSQQNYVLEPSTFSPQIIDLSGLCGTSNRGGTNGVK